MKSIARLLLLGTFALSSGALAQEAPTLEERLKKLEAALASGAAPASSSASSAAAGPKWYEKISIRGYAQLRYNRLFESNDQLKCEQCDRSLGSNGGVFLRRGRIIFSGDVHERVYLYIQPDFASDAAATSQHFAQLRDWYFDLALDPKKEYRLRLGQSKIPFGFENLQSSQNRLPLDRNDALNSALSNERDIGAFFYWAPEHIRKRFAELVSSGLKGSGDYGVFGAGVYNGQTANRPEQNDSLHAAARVSYPFKLANGQYFEPGVQGYTGRVVVPLTSRSSNAVGGPMEIRDHRAAVSFMWYPQPLGFQAEWNVGEGPEYDGVTRKIARKPLTGGYVQTMWLQKVGHHVVIPFVRGIYYRGGKKHETDARRYLVRQIEGGVEWQPHKNFELVTEYSFEDRAFQDDATRGFRQKGGRMRIQAQVNF